MAPSATGAVTTNFGLPTLSTGADAPDGIGINNIITAIDTAMLTLIPKSLGTTAGDLIYFSGASTPVRLPVGANNNVLTLSGGLPVWAAATGATVVRKVTATTVVNTVAETDLLAGAFTLAANALPINGVLRLTAWGDWKQNSGAATDFPRFKLKLGATTIFDSGITGSTAMANGANRYPWRMVCEVINLGAANSQWSSMFGKLLYVANTTVVGQSFTTGEGYALTEMFNTTSGASIGYTAGNATAVDTTASQALVLSVILPVANAATDMVLKGAIMEIM